MLVEVDADEHAKNAEDIDLEREAEREFDQNQVQSERLGDAEREVCREDVLDRPLRRHDLENFSENSAKQPSDQQKYKQNPGRFSHKNRAPLDCLTPIREETVGNHIGRPTASQ